MDTDERQELIRGLAVGAVIAAFGLTLMVAGSTGLGVVVLVLGFVALGGFVHRGFTSDGS